MKNKIVIVMASFAFLLIIGMTGCKEEVEQSKLQNQALQSLLEKIEQVSPTIDFSNLPPQSRWSFKRFFRGLIATVGADVGKFIEDFTKDFKLINAIHSSKNSSKSTWDSIMSSESAVIFPIARLDSLKLINLNKYNANRNKLPNVAGCIHNLMLFDVLQKSSLINSMERKYFIMDSAAIALGIPLENYATYLERDNASKSYYSKYYRELPSESIELIMID